DAVLDNVLVSLEVDQATAELAVGSASVSRLASRGSHAAVVPVHGLLQLHELWLCRVVVPLLDGHARCLSVWINGLSAHHAQLQLRLRMRRHVRLPAGLTRLMSGGVCF